jgi:hypothetical protein
MTEFKEKILKEMVVDHSNALEKNFDAAKRFLGITKEGKVHLHVDKKKLSGKEMILLYLIGKIYAKEAGCSDVDHATNKELMEELGFPEGTVWGYISQLNKENRIRQVGKGEYRIPINLIEKTLNEINSKVGGSDG